MGGKSSSKQTQSTQATQTTTNVDSSGEGSLAVGGSATFNIESLDAEVAGKAFDLADVTGERAFDFLGEAGTQILGYLAAERESAERTRAANLDITADLSRRAFELADEKTQSADDKVFNFGRVALYVGAAVLALIFLFLPSRPAKAAK